jgi:hypothetical protein
LVGVADADQADSDLQLVGPRPLGMRPTTARRARLKTVSEAPRTKTTTKKPEVVANLKKPSAATLKQLADAIDQVRALNATAQKDETLRLKKEKIALDVRTAFGIGKADVTGMEFDNRPNPNNFAETRETFIILFDDILVSPAFMANIILHETSHAQRNAELKAKTGKESSKLSIAHQEVFSLLKEFEATQLEIDSAAMTGITSKEKNAAQSLHDQHVKEIGTLLGEATRDRITGGDLDGYREEFFKKVKAK